MRYSTLGSTGLHVSVIGLGTSPFGGGFRTVVEAECILATRTALDLGINFIDTAPCYGDRQAEEILGRALKNVPRDRYFLATKTGQNSARAADYSVEGTKRSIEESCERLGTDYVDIAFCHDVEFAEPEQIINETIPALLKLKEAGRVRFVGLSGLPPYVFPHLLSKLPRGAIDVVLSFSHHNLANTALNAVLPELGGAGVINGAPFGMGLFTRGASPDWSPTSADLRARGARAVAQAHAERLDLPRIALQFATSNDRVPLTLVGSSDVEHLRGNVAATESPADWRGIALVLEAMGAPSQEMMERGLAVYKS